MRSKPRVLVLGGSNAAASAVLRLLRNASMDVTVANGLGAQVDGNFDVLVMCNPADRSILEDAAHLVHGKLDLDRVRQRVQYEGQEIVLTPHEYRILKLMMLKRGLVVARDQIRLLVWGDLSSASNAVDVHLGHLRRKLERTSGRRMISTARGRGYVLRAGADAGSKDGNHADPNH